VIIPDANVLLYAYDQSSPRHGPARRWVEETLSGEEPVGFAVVTLVAFLRIATNPAIYERPLAPGRAMEIVDSWLARPQVSVVNPSEQHWRVLAEVVERGQARGPLIVDAHLAALAIERGATLASTDRDFTRFTGLRLRDPLG